MANGDIAGAQPAKTQLRVGRLVKAHGLKGAFKLELYTDDPDGRFTPGSTFTLQVPESSPWHGRGQARFRARRRQEVGRQAQGGEEGRGSGRDHG